MNHDGNLSPAGDALDALDALLRQAARQRRRGDFRRAMQLLKQAAFEESDNAGIWTRYALACMSTGKRDDANKAFAQAIWLQERAGRDRGAEVTRELAALASEGKLPNNYDRSGKGQWRAFALRSGTRPVIHPSRATEKRHHYHKARSRRRRS